MPLFLDSHSNVPGLTRDAGAGAHQKDLAIQDGHDVKYMKYRGIGQAVAALLVVLAAGCGGGGPTEVADGSDDVVIRGSAFAPSARRIGVGTSVTWTNRDGISHTTTGGSGSSAWDSGVLAADRSFSHTFTVPGTYTYTCTIHPEMKGTIVVE